jgi:ADP-heptose:LPS heptosyltransferase
MSLMIFFKQLRVVGGPFRLLLVSLDNLGDVVFASSLVQSLRGVLPAANISIWCKSYARPVAELIPGLDRIHSADPFWDNAPGQGKGRLPEFFRCLREIRRERYDLILLLTRGSKPLIAASMLGAPAIIGRSGGTLTGLMVGYVPGARPDVPVLDELHGFCSATFQWLGQPLPKMPGIPVPYRLDRGKVRSSGVTLPQGTVALHPFAGSARRCLPVSLWKDFAQRLCESGRPVLWIGSSAELEALREPSIVDGSEYFVDRLPGIPRGLAGSIQALASCSAFVGHDSGPLHIAGGLGLPVLGIFAPGEPGRTFPQGLGPRRWVHRGTPGEFSLDLILNEFRTLQFQCEGVPDIRS